MKKMETQGEQRRTQEPGFFLELSGLSDWLRPTFTESYSLLRWYFLCIHTGQSPLGSSNFPELFLSFWLRLLSPHRLYLWFLRPSPNHSLRKDSSTFSGNVSRGSLKATILLPKQNNPTKPLSGHLNPVYWVVMATIQEPNAKTRINSHKWSGAQGRAAVLRVEFPRSPLNCGVLSRDIFFFFLILIIFEKSNFLDLPNVSTHVLARRRWFVCFYGRKCLGQLLSCPSLARLDFFQ